MNFASTDMRKSEYFLASPIEVLTLTSETLNLRESQHAKMSTINFRVSLQTFACTDMRNIEQFRASSFAVDTQTSES